MDGRSDPGCFQKVSLAVDSAQVDGDVSGAANDVAGLALLPGDGYSAGSLGSGVVWCGRPARGAIALNREVIFGPVLGISTFTDDTAAVDAANATDYGLVAGIWTSDVGRAHRMATDIRAGQVFINTTGTGGGVELPFGGWKGSGYGRQKGIEGLLGYTQTKTVVIGS